MKRGRANLAILLVLVPLFQNGLCRDEDKIMKACYWPNEIYESCFGGCAEVSCDNPRNHLRPCYPYCEPGCVCEEPYVRDDRTHLCVLPQDCSPTQMGIPVPIKKITKSQKYNGISRSYNKQDGPSPPPGYTEHEQIGNHADEFKRPSDISRMGNYFNIVIAPPSIKALQPRKMLHDEMYRSSVKRI